MSEVDELAKTWHERGWEIHPNAIKDINHLIARKEKEAVEELKRRWREDRKTMDYSPDTYDFICDKFIEELKSKQGE